MDLVNGKNPSEATIKELKEFLNIMNIKYKNNTRKATFVQIVQREQDHMEAEDNDNVVYIVVIKSYDYFGTLDSGSAYPFSTRGKACKFVHCRKKKQIGDCSYDICRTIIDNEIYDDNNYFD